MFGPSKRELLRIIERERVTHRVEVGMLLDRLADLAQRPWTPSPASMVEAPTDDGLVYYSAVDVIPEDFA